MQQAGAPRSVAGTESESSSTDTTSSSQSTETPDQPPLTVRTNTEGTTGTASSPVRITVDRAAGIPASPTVLRGVPSAAGTLPHPNGFHARVYSDSISPADSRSQSPAPAVVTAEEADARSDALIQLAFTPDEVVAPVIPPLPTEDWQPGQNLLVYYFTWNLGLAPPPEDISVVNAAPSHIVCVATQENGGYSGGGKLQQQWAAMVEGLLGQDFALVATEAMMACHLMVFARHDVFAHINNVQQASYATGIANMVGNKGATAISFTVGVKPSSFTMLFVGCHLTPHQANVQRRNRDYAGIVRNLKLGTRGCGGSVAPRPVGVLDSDTDSAAIKRDVTDEYDVCFFGGDLNYRINGTWNAIAKIAEDYRGMRAVLSVNDQLNIEKKKGTVFHRFQEGPLTFRPTYKYFMDNVTKLATDHYDFRKQRIPAYCDRVLYKKHAAYPSSLQLIAYREFDELRTSDHRAVGGYFLLGTPHVAQRHGDSHDTVAESTKCGCCCIS